MNVCSPRSPRSLWKPNPARDFLAASARRIMTKSLPAFSRRRRLEKQATFESMTWTEIVCGGVLLQTVTELVMGGGVLEAGTRGGFEVWWGGGGLGLEILESGGGSGARWRWS